MLKLITRTSLACSSAAEAAGRHSITVHAVIMPATCLLDGVGIAARLREFTAHFTWKMAVRVSASFGLAVFEPPSPIDAEEFFKQADSELYRAKQTGKNRICHPALSPSQARLRQPVDRGEREALFGLETTAHIE